MFLILAMLGALVLGATAAPPRGQTADLMFEEVVLGENHGCGRMASGRVACWGQNDRGQLGDGTYNNSAFPREVVGVNDAVGLASGATHTCALHRDRSVSCWGDNQAGQLGGGSREAHPEPVSIQALEATLAIAAGTSHTCAVALSGKVSCWGDNLYRQLGVDDLRRAPRPVPVKVDPAVDIAAGYVHTCAATREGKVLCWGDASHFAVGRPEPGSGKPLPPLPVETPLPNIRAIDARGQWTCALHAEGVHCWGSRPGEGAPGSPPSLVIKQAGLVQLSVGDGHGCALHPRGEATCFGLNDRGQLGHVRPARPIVVGSYGVRDATWVAAGYGESCAARGTSGRTVCWGNYTREEQAAAAKETQELPPDEPDRRFKAPKGTEIDLAIQEVLRDGPSLIRIEIRTLDNQPCANTRLDVDPKLKGRRLKLWMGDPYLPEGKCIAQPAPAVGLVDLPDDYKGRLDLTVRWKNQEDLYQVFVRKDRVEVIPMLSTFSRWPDPKKIFLIPDGSLAVTCVDHLEAAICQRRVRDGLPTCKDLLAEELVRDAPPLKRREWANDFFTADPRATWISPDFEHGRYQQLFQEGYRDGSQCLDLRVRTWKGRLWNNQVKETAAP